MKSLLPFLTLGFALFLFSCAEQKQVRSDEEIDAEAAKEAKESYITGYASIEELTEEVVYSIRENDYDDYVRHVMTKEMEETLSNEIDNEGNRDHFVSEFSFSIDREKEEFDNMVTFLKQNKVNLDSINYDEIEIVDYHDDIYAPLNIKEVLIIVPHEYEVLMIYKAIEIGGRWYLTSELEF